MEHLAEFDDSHTYRILLSLGTRAHQKFQLHNMCGFHLPRLVPIFDQYHMMEILLVLAALFVGSAIAVESSVRGAIERLLHGYRLATEKPVASDEKIERARCKDEKARVEEVERVRWERWRHLQLLRALDARVAKNVQRTVPLSTESLLSPEGHDAENEASRSHLKRTSTWKDVVERISFLGEIDIDELDSSLHDEEVYTSVNEAA